MDKRITYVAAKYPYWGRGETKEAAVKRYRKEGGRGKPKVAKVEWIPNPDVGENEGPWVTDFGDISIPGKLASPIVEA